MPSSSTITSFYIFNALTTIKSSEVNTNFSNFRGSLIPIDPSTATSAATMTYDLGVEDHAWRNTYIKGLHVFGDTVGATPPAGFYNIFVKSTTGKAYIKNSSAVEAQLGTGGGGVNFITDGDAEGSQILTVYNNASTTRPTTGTGGTQANLAVSISATSPLAGTNSFLLTKSGSASTQGSGASIPFTIDSTYKAKVLQIEFDYIVNSGTFAAGSSSSESDVIVYLYDVTNSQLIEPSGIKLLSNSSTISDKYTANFQTSATGTSYRLILHCQSISTANYSLKLDNIVVKPSTYVYGTPITDWVAYTPTMVGFGTTTNNDSYWRRVGDSVELSVKFNVGTPTATEARLPLPTGLVAGKFGSTLFHLAGRATRDNAGASFSRDFGLFSVTGNSYLTFSIIETSGSTSGQAAQNGSSIAAASDGIVIRTTGIPILGWSSSTQVSDGYDGRQIIAQVFRSSTGQVLSGSSDTKIQFNGKSKDTTNSFDATTNYRFTVSSVGSYKFTGSIMFGTSSGVSNVSIHLYKNGAPLKTVGYSVLSTTLTSNIVISAQADGNASDYFELFVNTSGSTVTLMSDASIYNGSQWNIEKSQAPTTISATSIVAASYNASSGQSITSAAIFTNFTTKLFDTHGIYNTSTGIGTISEPGLYKFSVVMTSVNATAGGWQISIRKNSANYLRIGSNYQNVTNQYVCTGSITIQFNSGDTFDFYNTSPIASGATYASSADNIWSVEKIK